MRDKTQSNSFSTKILFLKDLKSHGHYQALDKSFLKVKIYTKELSMATETSTPGVYADRADAGRSLAKKLAHYAIERPVVAGLPRGGVVVAAVIARALKCDLDIILAGKLRAPFNPELAIGGITEGGIVYVNKDEIQGLRITEAYIEKEKKEKLSLLKERLRLYRAIKKKIPLSGRTVIIVDDGLATGATMISAIKAAKAEGAAKIVAAVPGGPEDTINLIRQMPEVDAIVCPLIPPLFFAVSQIYADFEQVEDNEVIETLKASSA